MERTTTAMTPASTAKVLRPIRFGDALVWAVATVMR
jgi:hypothetical protein